MSRNPLPERILSFVGCSLNAIAFKFIASATKVLHIPEFFMHFFFLALQSEVFECRKQLVFLEGSREQHVAVSLLPICAVC